ncbi:MAG: hypothetical protein GX088_06350 [Clostridia bacterium]|nr:hypothetical protein [Clostridia bacterium]
MEETLIKEKFNDLKNQKCYIVEYQCYNATPGRLVVVAHNGYDAIKRFIKDWKAKYRAGEVSIPLEELQNLKVQEWCSFWNESLGIF